MKRSRTLVWLLGMALLATGCFGRPAGRPMQVINRSERPISLHWRSSSPDATPQSQPLTIEMAPGETKTMKYDEGEGFEPKRSILLVKIGENRFVELVLPPGHEGEQHMRFIFLGCEKK